MSGITLPLNHGSHSQIYMYRPHFEEKEPAGRIGNADFAILISLTLVADPIQLFCALTKNFSGFFIKLGHLITYYFSLYVSKMQV